MARVKSRWNLKDRTRSAEEIASAAAANIWRIAGQALLNLENEGFETISHSQRLDVIAEFVAFLLHITDRLVYDSLDQETRGNFINVLALRLTDIMQDNRRDADGQGEYSDAFVEFLNDRASAYCECRFSKEEGPGFSLKRTLGEYVRSQMGAKDNKWIPDYVMDVEVPEAMSSLQGVLSGLLDSTTKAPKPPLREGGVWGEG
jgi:hypothetical protein